MLFAGPPTPRTRGGGPGISGLAGRHLGCGLDRGHVVTCRVFGRFLDGHSPDSLRHRVRHFGVLVAIVCGRRDLVLERKPWVLIRRYLRNSSNFPLTTCTMTNLLSLDDHFLFFSSMLLAGKVKWKRSSKSMLTFSRVLSSFLLAPLFPFPSSPLLTVLLRTFLVAIPQCRFVQCVNKLCSCGLQ
uniref:(northern house mosquito) hypothetical protein n=1 Tax=Culex pipiens TaxID=7175 RepID=A0A8D8GC49_CULPI